MKDTQDQIYKSLASDGYVSVEDAKAALGDAFDLPTDAQTDHRVKTIVRTNTFEAINEARYNYFNDPALTGFVQAMEYSAIMDARTTAICDHLDGQIHHKDSAFYNEFKPPNHYNCRSLLIVVTANDSWKESPLPTMHPQKGFGKT